MTSGERIVAGVGSLNGEVEFATPHGGYSMPAELAALVEVFEYTGPDGPAISVRPRESDPPALVPAPDNPEG